MASAMGRVNRGHTYSSQIGHRSGRLKVTGQNSPLQAQKASEAAQAREPCSLPFVRPFCCRARGYYDQQAKKRQKEAGEKHGRGQKQKVRASGPQAISTHRARDSSANSEQGVARGPTLSSHRARDERVKL